MLSSPLVTLLAVAALLQAQEPPASLTGARIDVPAAGTSVPMLDIGGRPMVDILINGKGPFPFILDTGATATTVDDSLVEELALATGPEIGGRRTVRFDEFRLGDIVGHGFVAGRMGSVLGGLGGPSRPRGVLSAAEFPGHLVVLDYPAKRVTITRGALPAPDNRRVFEYPADEVLPVIPVRVAGHEYHIHLDSGSPAGVLLPTRYAAELPLGAPLVTVGQARTVAGTFAVQIAPVNGAIEIGEFTLDLKEIRFSDLRPGPQPGIGNVGAEALRTFVVTFDSQNRRVRFDRA